MLPTTVIALILGSWASLYLLDVFFKTHKYLSRCYIDLLNATGLSVGIGQLRWYTTLFNRLFVRLGQSGRGRGRTLLRLWFTAGVVFGLVASFLSTFLLILMLYNTLNKKPAEEQILTPVMPGVNLPSSQVGYYLLTLLVCGILHEMGHAVAACREQVRVNGFGIFIFGIYPGAFVDLYTEHLQAVSPLRQLRIYCAGVWHNFIIVIVALLILVSLPWTLAPFYGMGNAVVITSVEANSAVSGPKGLHAGDQVTGMNGCRVDSLAAWITCLTAAMQEHSSPGNCVQIDLLKQQDISTFAKMTAAGYVECCANTSNTHLCFAYNKKGESNMSHACLPARSTTERGALCRLQSDCYNPNSPSVCAVPSLDNSTKLIRLTHRTRPALLFLGHPLDLHYAVTLSNYVPHYMFLPVNLPYVTETFCQYLISLSGALALLNVVPCYLLDGQWILLSFIELTLPSIIPCPHSRRSIYTVILLMGSALLASNLVIAMFTLLVR